MITSTAWPALSAAPCPSAFRVAVRLNDVFRRERDSVGERLWVAFRQSDSKRSVSRIVLSALSPTPRPFDSFPAFSCFCQVDISRSVYVGVDTDGPAPSTAAAAGIKARSILSLSSEIPWAMVISSAVCCPNSALLMLVYRSMVGPSTCWYAFPSANSNHWPSYDLATPGMLPDCVDSETKDSRPRSEGDEDGLLPMGRLAPS